MNAQIWIAILVGVAATIDDLSRRQISNWISLAALAGGLGWQIGQDGWRGGWNALLGTAAGFAVFLIFYLMGGMGGGDIKLMAGFGALLGASRLLEAALWTAGVGGLLALAIMAVRFLRKRWGIGARVSEKPQTEGGHDSIPYAPAITLGVWLSLVPKG